MRWRLVHLLMETGDFSYARLSNGSAGLEAMFYVDLRDRIAVLCRLDIQGAGPNMLGWAALRDLVQQVMEMLDVDELRIEGAARTSGAGPGRRPAPLVFRRTG
jgi:hypothetical protein